MADILASSFKIVFVLLSFGVTIFVVGIRVSISHYICRDVSSNFLSVSSCLHTLLAICSFRISHFLFGSFYYQYLFCSISSFIVLSIRSLIHVSVFCKKPVTEAATRCVLYEKLFSEISQNSQENTCVPESLFKYLNFLKFLKISFL